MSIATRGRLEATISNLKAQQARNSPPAVAPVATRPPTAASQQRPAALPQSWFNPRPTFQSAPVPTVRVDTMSNNLARMTMLQSEPQTPSELGLG